MWRERVGDAGQAPKREEDRDEEVGSEEDGKFALGTAERQKRQHERTDHHGPFRDGKRDFSPSRTTLAKRGDRVHRDEYQGGGGEGEEVESKKGEAFHGSPLVGLEGLKGLKRLKEF